MWLNILITIVVSIGMIATIHHLICYFRDTYTEKKTKNITEIQSQKYKSIMNSVQEMNQREKRELEEKLYVLHQQNQSYSSQNHSHSPQSLSVQDLQAVNQDLDQFIQSQIAW